MWKLQGPKSNRVPLLNYAIETTRKLTKEFREVESGEKTTYPRQLDNQSKKHLLFPVMCH